MRYTEKDYFSIYVVFIHAKLLILSLDLHQPYLDTNSTLAQSHEVFTG